MTHPSLSLPQKTTLVTSHAFSNVISTPPSKQQERAEHGGIVKIETGLLVGKIYSICDNNL